MGWIKIETHLGRKSEIIRLALLLDISPHEAVGLCIEFWSWADAETTDGTLPGCTPVVVDGVVGRDGFASALIDVGWLQDEGGRMTIPNFLRHNGESTKKRALDAMRQRRKRSDREAACPAY